MDEEKNHYWQAEHVWASVVGGFTLEGGFTGRIYQSVKGGFALEGEFPLVGWFSLLGGFFLTGRI